LPDAATRATIAALADGAAAVEPIAKTVAVVSRSIPDAATRATIAAIAKDATPERQTVQVRIWSETPSAAPSSVSPPDHDGGGS
jgi:hypothetical protein